MVLFLFPNSNQSHIQNQTALIRCKYNCFSTGYMPSLIESLKSALIGTEGNYSWWHNISMSEDGSNFSTTPAGICI